MNESYRAVHYAIIRIDRQTDRRFIADVYIRMQFCRPVEMGYWTKMHAGRLRL